MDLSERTRGRKKEERNAPKGIENLRGARRAKGTREFEKEEQSEPPERYYSRGVRNPGSNRFRSLATSCNQESGRSSARRGDARIHSGTCDRRVVWIPGHRPPCKFLPKGRNDLKLLGQHHATEFLCRSFQEQARSRNGTGSRQVQLFLKPRWGCLRSFAILQPNRRRTLRQCAWIKPLTLLPM